MVNSSATSDQDKGLIIAIQVVGEFNSSQAHKM